MTGIDLVRGCSKRRLPPSHQDNDEGDDGDDDENTRCSLPVNKSSGLPKAVIYCLVLEFMLEMSNSILTVPLLSLFERSVCAVYYDRHNLTLFANGAIDESQCKIQPIQSELARIRGWKAFFDTLSGEEINAPLGISILTMRSSSFAVFPCWFHCGPYQSPQNFLCDTDRDACWLDMDRFHRYSTFLSLERCIELTKNLIFEASHANLPLRVVWLSSVFYLCGGGNYAAEMMMDVIAADQCSESNR